MSSRFRFIWHRISRVKVGYRYVPIITSRRIPKISAAVPFTLGFSLFTWLGFQKKLTAEDELINTIKHCVLFIQRAEYAKAEQLLHVALRQAQNIHHHLGITYIYDVMANLALEREQLDKAKKLFVSVSQRIMADGATEEDTRFIHISVKLARICHLKKDYTTARLGYDWCLEKLTKVFEKEPTEEIKKLIAMTEDWYGRLLIDCNQGEQGLKLMISSLERMKEVTDVEQEHFVIQLNDIGTVYDQLGKSDESIKCLKDAIDLGKKLEMEELGAMYVNLGRAYIRKKLWEEARKNCGYGWKLGTTTKNDEIKGEAEECLQKIKSLS